MKAAEITHLRFLFDMYYCVFYNKNIFENPESIFSFLSSVGKNRTKDTTEETEVKYCKKKGVRNNIKCNKTTRGNAKKVTRLHKIMIIYSSFTREFPTGVSAFLQGTLGII